MTTRILNAVLVLIAAVAGFAAFRLLEASLEADVYRERLGALSADYESLRSRYNDAVRRTAVTELLVGDATLDVVIRNAAGEMQTLSTPFDPKREIYVDYVVLDGRLWIRRLFDEGTAPDQGFFVDPRLVDVDWTQEGASHGKAAYRALEPGRWVVDVTGDGSLGLARRNDDLPTHVAPAPPIREYTPVEHEVGVRLGEIEPAEAFDALMRQLDLRGSAALLAWSVSLPAAPADRANGSQRDRE
ncbi:MAG: hypothetical protein QF570_04040 [Myxococcota bacterium]|jgi:hypothetical protein|nr:hypothetical protein [Myxococcota bacterium]